MEHWNNAKELVFKLRLVSPDDPQCNDFAENVVKSLCKLIHTSAAEQKDVKAEMYKYLLQYRATPHSTTEKITCRIVTQQENTN